MYAIWRVFFPELNKENKYIKTVLTEAEAQEHCSNPDSRVSLRYYDIYKKDIE